MYYTKRLKELREEKKYTKKNIADFLGMAERTYTDVESGAVDIYVDDTIKLAKLYNVNMNYICGVSNIRKPFQNE